MRVEATAGTTVIGLLLPAVRPQIVWESGSAELHGEDVCLADEETIVREVEAFYRRYIEAWNHRDPEEIAYCYDRPHVGLSGGHAPSLVSTDAEQERWCLEALALYDEQRWEHTEIDRLQVWPFSASLAQLISDLGRYGKDGSLLRRGRYCYMLRRRQDGWRVMTFAVVEEPFSGPGLSRRVAQDR
jgi:hypothetical protein